MKKKLYTSLATGAFALLTAPTAFAQTLPSVCTSVEDMYAPEGCLFQGDDIYEHTATGAMSTPGRVVAYAFEGADGVRSADLALVGSGYVLEAPGTAPSGIPTEAPYTIPPAAIDALDDRHVDIVYFDFGIDNNNFAQAKSYVLQDAIRSLNAWRGVEGSDDGNMIYIGMSLAGVVGRHALSSLENAGYDHKVRTMFTWDSPHLGANVPIAIQQMPKELIKGTREAAHDLVSHLFSWWPGYREAAAELNEFADYAEGFLEGMIVNPASQQLIIKHVYESELGMHPYGVELQRELKELGLPQNSHNVAVVAGGVYANPADHGRKPKFFDFDGTMNGSFTASFDVWRDDAEPHLQGVLITDSIWVAPYYIDISSEDSMDTVPCSTIDLPGEFSDFVFGQLAGEGFTLNSQGNYQDNVEGYEVYDSQSCFVPTLSSMGIDSLPIGTHELPSLSELEERSPFDELYAGHSENYHHNSPDYWDYQDSYEEHLDRTYGSGSPGTPCSQICENPTAFEQPAQQLTNLGTQALCMEFPQSVSAMVFGGLESRVLSVNGVSFGTGGWTDNLPPTINGGYCMSAPAGSNAWAWISTWQ